MSIVGLLEFRGRCRIPERPRSETFSICQLFCLCWVGSVFCSETAGVSQPSRKNDKVDQKVNDPMPFPFESRLRNVSQKDTYDRRVLRCTLGVVPLFVVCRWYLMSLVRAWGYIFWARLHIGTCIVLYPSWLKAQESTLSITLDF